MRKFTLSPGFTLLETLITIGLLSILIGFSLTSGISTSYREFGRMDSQMILGALQKARAEAMSGICSDSMCDGPVSDGISISSTQIAFLEGSRTEETLPFSAPETLTGSSTIMFAPGSGDVSGENSLTITGSDHLTQTISINSEGAISLIP